MGELTMSYTIDDFITVIMIIGMIVVFGIYVTI